MYMIFIHLLGLAILEIIFYFYYIGPFEHNVFVDSFGRSIGGLIKKMDSNYEHPDMILNYTLGSNDELLNELETDANNSENNREEYNKNLFDNTIKIWIYCFVIINFFMIIYLRRNKLKCKKNLNTSTSQIELVNMTTNSNNNAEVFNHQENKKKSIYLKIGEYVFFAGLVLFFEYLFFQYVVLEYHIITDEQIQYLIYQQIYDFYQDYYIFN